MVSVLCAPGCEGVEEKWFSPTFWGKKAVAVGTGGRGGAWFVSTNKASLVLRHYRRGGLASRVSERRYLFSGFDRTRSFVEFRLLSELHDKGLPVPKPIAAMVARTGTLFYEAAILIERIESAQPLPEHPRVNDGALWRQVGQTIARFHYEGLNHVDLNCDNILVTDEQVFLIDFDRCRLHSEAAVSSNWKARNLKRLRRSVQKRCADISDIQLETLWKELVSSYQKATDAERFSDLQAQ